MSALCNGETCLAERKRCPGVCTRRTAVQIGAFASLRENKKAGIAAGLSLNFSGGKEPYWKLGGAMRRGILAVAKAARSEHPRSGL